MGAAGCSLVQCLFVLVGSSICHGRLEGGEAGHTGITLDAKEGPQGVRESERQGIRERSGNREREREIVVFLVAVGESGRE